MGTDLLLSLQALAKEVLHQLAQGREGGFTHRPQKPARVAVAGMRMGTDLLLSLQALAKEVLHQLAQGREGGFTHRPLPSESLEPEPTAHCPGPTTPARPSHTSRYAGYCGAPDRPPGKGFWR